VSLALAIMVVVGFVLVGRQVHLFRDTRYAGRNARITLSVISDASLSDDEKELRLRKESGRLFGLFAKIVLEAVTALGVPVAALWGLDLGGVASAPDTLAVLLRIDFLAAVTVLGFLAYFWASRRTAGS
jgi:hypothetical protein